MPTITFRSPVTKPLLRAGTPKPVPPDPRAYDTFRVTQQFDTPDSYWAARDIAAGREPRTHSATDIGCFRCGDPVVAMAAGTLTRVHDNASAIGGASDALGVVIDHGGGISTEYWHLNAYSGPSNGAIAAGEQIGVVGQTGLGNVCHLHVEAKRNGVKFDPEPLMFGVSVNVEDDMKLPSGLSAYVYAAIGPGNRIRVGEDPSSTEGSIITDTTERVQVFADRDFPNVAYTLGGKTGTVWTLIGRGLQTGWVAKPLLTVDLTQLGRDTIPLPVADCSAQDNKITAARTAVAGAKQAHGVELSALDAALRALT